MRVRCWVSIVAATLTCSIVPASIEATLRAGRPGAAENLAVVDGTIAEPDPDAETTIASALPDLPVAAPLSTRAAAPSLRAASRSRPAGPAAAGTLPAAPITTVAATPNSPLPTSSESEDALTEAIDTESIETETIDTESIDTDTTDDTETTGTETTGTESACTPATTSLSASSSTTTTPTTTSDTSTSSPTTSTTSTSPTTTCAETTTPTTMPTVTTTPTPTPDPTITDPTVTDPTTRDPVQLVTGRGNQNEVDNDDQLAEALSVAGPGDTVRLQPGTYQPVTLTSAGTAADPITLSGPATAVIQGDRSGYALHLDGARYWQLTGFSVAGGTTTVMADDAQHVVLDSMIIGDGGEEGVHFHSSSSDNVLQRSTVHDTGGEGVYVGTATSDGDADRSMDNRVLDNDFRHTAAENVDIKEEAGGTVVADNDFDGSAVGDADDADSVVDISGYDSTVTDNVTTGNSAQLLDIIQTHVVTTPERSGCGNTIERNTVEGFTPRGEIVVVDPKCDES